jgi:hypothetical protein
VRNETTRTFELVEVKPNDLCDRCDHPLKYHAPPRYGSECRIVDGRYWRGDRVPRGMRALQCFCDGFFAKP